MGAKGGALAACEPFGGEACGTKPTCRPGAAGNTRSQPRGSISAELEIAGDTPVGLPGSHLHIQGQRPRKSWAGSRRNEWCGVGGGLHFEGVGSRGSSQEGQAREAGSSQGGWGLMRCGAVEVLTGTLRT